MDNNINPKEKIIERIKKEKIEYKESFNMSFINQYSYIVETKHNINNIEEKKYIIAPKFSDDSLLVQTYLLAHELGHHNCDNKSYQFNNILVKNIIERKAWEEAKNICVEESILVEKEFYKIRDKCLKTYTKEIKRSINGVISSIFHIIKAYYLILICLYIACKCCNDNIMDLFGILKYFKGISSSSIYYVTNWLWVLYITIYIQKIVIKKISIVNDNTI